MTDSDHPSVSPETPDWWSRLGLFSLYVFAAFGLLGTSPAAAGLGLLTLLFVLRFRDWGLLGRDPVAILALLFGLYVAIHTLVMALLATSPEQVSTLIEHGVDWIKLVLFVPLAFWVAGHPRRIRLLLLLALLGFTIGFLRKIDWAAFDASFFATRFESYLPAIAFGLFTALGALGLLALRHAFWGRSDQPWWHAARVVAWLILLLIMLEGLMLSQSRISWLAFLAALGLLALLEWRVWWKTARRSGQRRGWISLGLGAGLVLALVLSQYQTIETRLSQDRDTLGQVMRGEVSAAPTDPVGLRFKALAFAYEKWSERPVFGWGAGASRELIASSGRRDALWDQEHWLAHLHNSYAETLIQLGAAGLILALALVWALARSTRRACRAGWIPPDLCRFLLVTLVLVLIWSFFNYRLLRSDWLALWTLFAGIAYSFQLAAPRADAESGRA